MNIYIILILLGFTRIAICSHQLNVTYDESYPVCPVNLFRRKRAHTEYTRWKFNEDTTPQFLVKVLDEDLTTPNTNQIVAVNIQSITKGTEKIIVGGVIVPPMTTPSAVSDGIHDYTRFVPPTAVSQRNDEQFPTPQNVRDNVIPPIKPNVGHHSLRDESPPAGPQFLARTPILLARQYAPIAQVAFTRRPPITPRKLSTSFNLHDTVEYISPPTRTSLADLELPTRTRPDSDEFNNFIDGEQKYATIARRINKILYSPHRSSITTDVVDSEDLTPVTEQNSINFEDIVEKSKIHEKIDQESDDMYNMMLYADDYNDTVNKNKDHISSESNEESLIKNKESATDVESINISSATVELDYDDESEYNVTVKSPFRRLFTPVAKITEGISTKEKDKNIHRTVCSLVKIRQLNFNSPRTLAEIYAQLKQWAENSPLVKWEDITNGNLTTMENPIHMLIIDDLSSGQIVTAKQTVMVIAGILGRDQHAVAAAMYVLYQLIERSESHTDLLSKYRFWVIPVFNPDGYDYSMTFPQRREWSKNLHQNWEACRNRESCTSCELYGLRCTVQPCYGVNLDRNFEYQWIPSFCYCSQLNKCQEVEVMALFLNWHEDDCTFLLVVSAEELRAEHPCGPLYAGARQLSEFETRALTTFLHEKHTPLFAFIAFKEGEVLGIMYPYSHTRKLRAYDNIYRQRASRAAAAAYGISGRPYVAGPTSEFLPLYAGGIEDWVDGHLGIDNTYTIMMFRPTDSYNSKLITERVVHEAYAAMDTLLLQSVEPVEQPSVVSLKRVSHSPRPPSANVILLISLLFLQICEFR